MGALKKRSKQHSGGTPEEKNHYTKEVNMFFIFISFTITTFMLSCHLQENRTPVDKKNQKKNLYDNPTTTNLPQF